MTKTLPVKNGRVQAAIEIRDNDLFLIVTDDAGNELVLRAQSTSADRIRVEPVSKKGHAWIDIHEHSKAKFYKTVG